MSKTIYVIELTEKAQEECAPSWDFNIKHVIAAANRVEARMMAEKAARDEPAVWWRENEWSAVRAVGFAPDPKIESVIWATESYSHG